MPAFKCAYCGTWGEKPIGEINRAKSAGLNLYCNRKHAGLGRRSGKTKAQKIAEKAAYDAEYRVKNRKYLKAMRALYFKQTYDPVKAAVERKKKMPRHVEYCRRPEYREWKSGYDKQYRAKKFFGPFAEAAMLAVDLNRAIKERSTNAEIKWQNKTCNKTQQRDRKSEGPKRTDARPRFRDRRDRHSAPVSQ